MKKLTEARDGKELSGVVFINQINRPHLHKPYVASQPPPMSLGENPSHHQLP